MIQLLNFFIVSICLFVMIATSKEKVGDETSTIDPSKFSYLWNQDAISLESSPMNGEGEIPIGVDQDASNELFCQQNSAYYKFDIQDMLLSKFTCTDPTKDWIRTDIQLTNEELSGIVVNLQLVPIESLEYSTADCPDDYIDRRSFVFVIYKNESKKITTDKAQPCKPKNISYTNWTTEDYAFLKYFDRFFTEQ